VIRGLNRLLRHLADGATHRVVGQLAPLHYRLEQAAQEIGGEEEPILFGIAYPEGRTFKSEVGMLVLTPTRLIYDAPPFSSDTHSSGIPSERKEILVESIQSAKLRRGGLFERCSMLAYADSLVVSDAEGEPLRFHVLNADDWVRRMDAIRAK
jgi:hypothetical protein